MNYNKDKGKNPTPDELEMGLSKGEKEFLKSYYPAESLHKSLMKYVEFKGIKNSDYKSIIKEFRKNEGNLFPKSDYTNFYNKLPTDVKNFLNFKNINSKNFHSIYNNATYINNNNPNDWDVKKIANGIREELSYVKYFQNMNKMGVDIQKPVNNQILKKKKVIENNHKVLPKTYRKSDYDPSEPTKGINDNIFEKPKKQDINSKVTSVLSEALNEAVEPTIFEKYGIEGFDQDSYNKETEYLLKELTESQLANMNDAQRAEAIILSQAEQRGLQLQGYDDSKLRSDNHDLAKALVDSQLMSNASSKLDADSLEVIKSEMSNEELSNSSISDLAKNSVKKVLNNNDIFSEEAMKDFNARNNPEREAMIQSIQKGLVSDFNRMDRAVDEANDVNVIYRKNGGNINKMKYTDSLNKIITKHQKGSYISSNGNMSLINRDLANRKVKSPSIHNSPNLPKDYKISQANLDYLMNVLYNGKNYTPQQAMHQFARLTQTNSRDLNKAVEYHYDETYRNRGNLNLRGSKNNTSNDYKVSESNLDFLTNVLYSGQKLSEKEAVDKYRNDYGVSSKNLDNSLSYLYDEMYRNKGNLNLRGSKPLYKTSNKTVSNGKSGLTESNLDFLTNVLYSGKNLSEKEAVDKYRKDYGVSSKNLNSSLEYIYDELQRNYANLDLRGSEPNSSSVSRGNSSSVSNSKNVKSPSLSNINFKEILQSKPTKGINDDIFSEEAMKDFNARNNPEREKYISDTIAGLKSDFERIERAEKETGKPANVIYDGKLPNPNEQAELEALRKRLSDEHRAKVNANPKDYMQEGGRTNQFYNPPLPYEFSEVNPNAVLEYVLQHWDGKSKSFDGVDVNKTLSYYKDYLPDLFKEYFTEKDGNYSLAQGKKYKDFQKGYNSYLDETGKLFSDVYGFDRTQVDDYRNKLRFVDNPKDTSRGIDDKYGRYTSSRSAFKRNVVTPEQLEQLKSKGIFTGRGVINNPDIAKSILGDDVYNDVIKGLDTHKNADYILGVIQKESEPKNETEVNQSVDSKEGLKPHENDETNYTNQMPLLTPDQSTLAPKYFGTRLRSVNAPWNVTNNVSAEDSIRKINNQSDTSRRLLSSANPYSSAAGIANIQAQENDAINTALMQTEMANQQAQNQTDMINESRIQQTDALNNQEATAYETRVNQGLDSYNKEWTNYIDRRNQERMVNYNMQNQANAFNAVNPNYNIGRFGEIYQTGEKFKIITDDLGNSFIKDPKTGAYTQIKTETKDGNTKTTTTTKPHKKGGVINVEALRKFLKR